MRTRLFGLALTLSCVVAAPVSAQLLINEGSDRAVSTAGPRDPRASDPGTFSGDRAGLRVTRTAYIVEDGSADVRQGVVGILPVDDTVSIGLGLYKVSRYSSTEPNFKRLRPMEDVDGRNQRIAAVGLNLRF